MAISTASGVAIGCLKSSVRSLVRIKYFFKRQVIRVFEIKCPFSCKDKIFLQAASDSRFFFLNM